MPANSEDRAFIRVKVGSIPVIIDALKAAGLESEAEEVRSFSSQYTDKEENAEREEYIERADTKDGEIEVDSDAAVSVLEDNGAYVMAWLWVDGDKEEDEDEEDDE